MKLSTNTKHSLEVLGAYFRQGCHEISNMLFGPGTAAAPPELGMIATKTPSQIDEGLRHKPEPLVSFSDRLKATDLEPSRDDRRESREMDRD